MNRVKLSWDRLSLVTVLSLGLMIFGIGCISWVMFNKWAQPDYSMDATPTAFAAELNKLTGDNTPRLELDHSFVNLYPEYPGEGDNIGTLTIPALNQKLPILQGTGMKELKKGVGHFTQSVLPGEKDNSVLSGHRETVFRKIGELKTGDQLIVQTSAGTFTYEVTGAQIVHEDDKTVIVPTDHAVLTLTTCYPFNTPGYSPERYIVSANLVISK